jgi:hypothetical protein
MKAGVDLFWNELINILKLQCAASSYYGCGNSQLSHDGLNGTLLLYLSLGDVKASCAPQKALRGSMHCSPGALFVTLCEEVWDLHSENTHCGTILTPT